MQISRGVATLVGVRASLLSLPTSPDIVNIDVQWVTEKDTRGYDRQASEPDFLDLLQVIPRLHLEDGVDVESMTAERSRQPPTFAESAILRASPKY
jgi:hypothetical protein